MPPMMLRADRQIAQGGKRLLGRDLGDDAEVVRHQPAPGADHLHAAVVAIGLEHHAMPFDPDRLLARSPCDRRRDSQRACGGLQLRGMPVGKIATGVPHLDPEGAAPAVVLGQHAGGNEFLRVPAGREQQPVVPERVGLRGRTRPGRRKDRVQFAVGLDAHGQRDIGRPGAGADRDDEPRDRSRLPARTTHRQFGFGIRTNELRRAVEREVEALAEWRGAQSLTAAQRILRRQHEAGPVDDAESDDVLGHERRLDARAELLGFLGAAPDPLCRVAPLRHEAGGACHHVVVGGDAYRLGHVLADPNVEPLHDRAEQGLETRPACLGEGRPHARVRPDAESDQQRAEQDRRRVAPRLRLDEPGDQIGDRASTRIRIARADVDRALLRLRRPGFAHGRTSAGRVARAVSLYDREAPCSPIVARTGTGGQPGTGGSSVARPLTSVTRATSLYALPHAPPPARRDATVRAA